MTVSGTPVGSASSYTRGFDSIAATARGALVPDADDNSLDFRSLELLAQLVELVQLGDRPDANAMPDIGVDGNALDLGVDPFLGELLRNAVGVRLVAVGACLEDVDT